MGWCSVACTAVTLCCASLPPLAGTIPANWSLPPKLISFYCYETRLTSSVPASFCLPDTLQVLQLVGHYLSGPFPNDWYLPPGLIELHTPSMKANVPLPRLSFPTSLKVGGVGWLRLGGIGRGG